TCGGELASCARSFSERHQYVPHGQVCPWVSPLPGTPGGCHYISQVNFHVCRWKNIQSTSLGGHREATVTEIGGAGALWRNHASPDGCLRRTGRSEYFAIPGLDDPFEHLAALAGLGVGHTQTRYLVAQLGIPVSKLGAQL